MNMKYFPEQPTKEMIEAAFKSFRKTSTLLSSTRSDLTAAFKAMYKVAPDIEQEPITHSIGDEFTACMKLPVIVHVRKQRDGETHISTREGLTPVKPDDLIMRGVLGEAYPIGRKIFEKTYTLDLSYAQPTRKPLSEEEIEKLVPWQGDPKDPFFNRIKFARLVEQAHGIGTPHEPT